MDSITIDINGNKCTISVDNAQELYEELHKIFGKEKTIKTEFVPCYPYVTFQQYPVITCSYSTTGHGGVGVQAQTD